MRLHRVRSLQSAQWDAVLAQTPGGGHFLQTHAWGALKRHFGWRPQHFVVRNHRGEVRGAALVLAYRTPLGRDVLYCPKGPWIDWQDPETVDTLLQGLKAWGTRHRAFVLRFDPHLRADDHVAFQHLQANGAGRAAWEMQYRTSWVVDLTGTEDQLLARMKAKTRYNVRLAARQGVRITTDTSDQALSRFYEMYKLTAERDGFPPRSADYIITACRAMLVTGGGTLLWASYQDKPLAALVACAFGSKAWYWLGASSSAERQLMPTYLVQWEAMRWARARGCITYDMTGIPSPDKLKEDDPFWGLYRFKSGFGGGVEDLIGTCELPIDPRVNQLWRRIEPAYYRIYQRLSHDVYY